MPIKKRWRDTAATWLGPMLVIVVALLVGSGLSRVRSAPGSGSYRFVFHGDATAARQVLVAVAGTMTTVTSLVFGLTVVALQLAATQYSPRLLRSFLRDRGARVVLSAFVGTVAYSLAGLQGIGGGTDRVPQVAVSGAIVLAIISLALLVYYIGHIVNGIRIESVTQLIEDEIVHLLQRDHPVLDGDDVDGDADDAARPPGGAATVLAPRSGYVQGVDGPGLLRLAERHNLMVRLVPLLGYHVVAGEPLAVVWSDAPTGLRGPDLLRQVADRVLIAAERKAEHDVGLGIRQLADIASRAMGTSQNDAYTAVQAVHHLTAALTEADRRSFRPRQLADRHGTVRVVVALMTYPMHLRVACAHVRQGGLERHPRVRLELLRLLARVASTCRGEHRRAAVEAELAAVLADAHRLLAPGADLDEVDKAALLAREQLARARGGPRRSPGASRTGRRAGSVG